MTQIELSGIEVQRPEEDMVKIRLYLKRGDFARAEEEMEAFEKKYQSLLSDVELEEFYCTVLAIKWEILTRGYSRMELGYKEEKNLISWYQIMVRLDRLPIKITTYLHHREAYLRSLKSVEFKELRKAFLINMVCGVWILVFGTLILCGIHELFDEVAYFVINGFVFMGSIGLIAYLWQDGMHVMEAYKSWTGYLKHPVPFEHMGSKE